MSLLAAAILAAGVAHLLAGVPVLLALGFVRSRLPGRYARAVGDRRAWRGFGAGVTSIGISLVIIARGLA